jgi:hypothetical protein
MQKPFQFIFFYSIRNHEKNAWNIRRLVYKSFVPSTQRTSMTYCRLSDFRYEMMVRGLFGHCAFMASRSDLIAGPQGWFLRFCSLACAAKRVNSLYFIQKLFANLEIQSKGWFLHFGSLACAAKRVNSPYFVQKLKDIKIYE